MSGLLIALFRLEETFYLLFFCFLFPLFLCSFIFFLFLFKKQYRKTCLLLRFVSDTFSPTFITTIGIDYKIKMVDIDDMLIKLQIWDTVLAFFSFFLSFFFPFSPLFVMYRLDKSVSEQSLSLISKERTVLSCCMM